MILVVVLVLVLIAGGAAAAVILMGGEKEDAAVAETSSSSSTTTTTETTTTDGDGDDDGEEETSGEGTTEEETTEEEVPAEELTPWAGTVQLTKAAGKKKGSSSPFDDTDYLSSEEMFGDNTLPKIVGARFWYGSSLILQGITFIYQDKDEDFLQSGFRNGKGGPGSATYMLADNEYFVKLQGWKQGSNKLTYAEFVTNRGNVAAYNPDFWQQGNRVLKPNWTIEVPKASGSASYAVVGISGFYDSSGLNEISLQYVNLRDFTQFQQDRFFKADKRGGRDFNQLTRKCVAGSFFNGGSNTPDDEAFNFADVSNSDCSSDIWDSTPSWTDALLEGDICGANKGFIIDPV